MIEGLKIEDLEKAGFKKCEDGLNGMIKPFGESGSYFSFHRHFNNCFEIGMNDGNEGHIAVALNIDSLDELAILERIFSGAFIDVGHTLSTV